MIKYELLQHVGLNVTDLEKAKHFYSQILCLKEVKRPDFDFEGAWYQLGDYQRSHLLVMPDSQTIRPDKSLSSKEGHLALRVENYQETLNWLKKNRIDVLEQPNSVSGFAQIFCADPDGNLIELNVERGN
ncbi:glyoxalase [Peribacillus cavernae]|uniref:Glyoxalase n=1 Tax=Peribacillus cavernae TaxID=1674310 RepID=A0A3S0VVG0_9BACI|nr:VOC family protein [Peribacillus cavernae]MDQ0221195.1 catechol 2,3-dioxygenase-like lactoylglutathione lyase family enzyme [Peribacillus cavernae]RUQ26926.1 glyoxalase [Peribacillus cavernae]